MLNPRPKAANGEKDRRIAALCPCASRIASLGGSCCSSPGLDSMQLSLRGLLLKPYSVADEAWLPADRERSSGLKSGAYDWGSLPGILVLWEFRLFTTTDSSIQFQPTNEQT